MKNFWKNKKVFITGHTGFKGSWLTLVLHSLGAKIAGYALNPISKPNFFDDLNLRKYLTKEHRQDINNFKTLNKAIKNFRPSIVFHLAAQSSVLVSYQKPRETVNANVIGTTNLLESVKKIKSIKSVIIVTTDKVYLNLEKKKKFKENEKLGGFDVYSSSKAACDIVTESYIKSFFSNTNCGVSIVRSGNCIGGGDWTKDRIVKDCAQSFAKNKKLIIRSPNATRPWQHVLDPLIGYLKLVRKNYNNNKFNGPWNFGPDTKKNLKVKQLVLIGKKIFNSKSKIILKKKQYYESENLALDSSKAKKFLNWTTKFDDIKSLDMTFKWYKYFYKNKNKTGLVKLSFDQINIFKSKHKI
jgi:CDP-glucose 4,6-dehydratase